MFCISKLPIKEKGLLQPLDCTLYVTIASRAEFEAFGNVYFTAPSPPLIYFLSHFWLATVQDVLHADWQDVWHSPQPAFFKFLFSVLPFSVFICFMVFPP